MTIVAEPVIGGTPAVDHVVAAAPLLLTATQLAVVAHETETVARNPPGNTSVGDFQCPPAQSSARPLRPSAVQDEEDAQDTDRAKSDRNPGMGVEDVQCFPLNVTNRPDPATAMQNDDDGQETEIRPLTRACWLGVQPVPSKTSVCPSRFTAMHILAVGHDTSMSRSPGPVEGGVG
jgi:hypothetical protein